MPTTMKTRSNKTRPPPASSRRHLKPDRADVTCAAPDQSADPPSPAAPASSVAQPEISESLHEQKKYRNRTSAVRHRRRKKEMESDLDSKEHALMEQHESLKKGIEEMKSLRLELKGMLMSHSMCGFGPIDHYHMQSAQSVSAGSAMPGMAASQAAGQAVAERDAPSHPGSDNDTTGYPSPGLESVISAPAVASALASPQLQSPDDGSTSTSHGHDLATSPIFNQPIDFSQPLHHSQGPESGACGPSQPQENSQVVPNGSQLPDAPLAGPRTEKVQRSTSNFSADSGYRTEHAPTHPPAQDSPDSEGLNDEQQQLDRIGSVWEADELQSTIGTEPLSSFTSTHTTPVDTTWKGYPGEYESPYGPYDAPLFDDVCCPMDTLMDRQHGDTAMDDEFFNSLFPTAG